MMAAPLFVPDVPGLCRGLCRVFHWCAGCAGSPMCVRTYAKNKTQHINKHVSPRICTRHTRHTRHSVDIYTYFRNAPGTTPGTPGTGTPRARSFFIFCLKKNVMKNENTPTAKKTITCTPENAKEMQQIVKNWPELHQLVQHLQAQDLFPGLRGLSITLTGSQEFVAGGLASVNAINAHSAV